jgi:hypothetical protein
MHSHLQVHIFLTRISAKLHARQNTEILAYMKFILNEFKLYILKNPSGLTITEAHVGGTQMLKRCLG